MADSSLELHMRLKDDKVQTGLDALARKEDDVAKAAQKIARSAKMADEGLTKFANRQKELTSTPVEKYNRQMDLLNESLRRGKLNQDEYARAIARAKHELEKATTVTAEAVDEQQDLFGPSALGQLTMFVHGYVTLEKAVNLVGEAFRFARQESEEALGSLRGLDDARRKLNQIAESPEQLQAMMTRADTAAATYGIDRKDAYQALFDAYNYGIQGDYETILAGRQVFDPAAAVKVGGKLQSQFPGLTAMEGINMTLRAAAASEADFEQFAPTMAIAGEGALQQGAGAAETMAAVSVLAARFKNSQIAADRVKTFLAKSSQAEGLAGKGLMGSLDALQAMPEDQRREILKTDMEMNAAFAALIAERGKIQAEAAAIEAARGGQPLAAGMQRAGATPQMIAATLDQAGKVNAELQKELQLGTGEAAIQSAANQQAALSNQLGLPFFRRFGSSAARGIATFLGGGPQSVAAAGVAGDIASQNVGLATVGSRGVGALPDAISFGRQIVELVRGQNQFASETVVLLRQIRSDLSRGAGRAAQAEAKQAMK